MYSFIPFSSTAYFVFIPVSHKSHLFSRNLLSDCAYLLLPISCSSSSFDIRHRHSSSFVVFVFLVCGSPSLYFCALLCAVCAHCLLCFINCLMRISGICTFPFNLCSLCRFFNSSYFSFVSCLPFLPKALTVGKRLNKTRNLFSE